MLWVKEGGRSEMRAPGPESREPAPGRHRYKTEEGTQHNFTHFIFFTGTSNIDREWGSIKYEWAKHKRLNKKHIENLLFCSCFRVAARVLLLEFQRTLEFNIFLTRRVPASSSGDQARTKLQAWRALNIKICWDIFSGLFVLILWAVRSIVALYDTSNTGLLWCVMLLGHKSNVFLCNESEQLLSLFQSPELGTQNTHQRQRHSDQDLLLV